MLAGLHQIPEGEGHSRHGSLLFLTTSVGSGGPKAPTLCWVLRLDSRKAAILGEAGGPGQLLGKLGCRGLAPPLKPPTADIPAEDLGP